jgi:glycerol-3-phosphate O-acyltransferase/dihydroxyacetone phosphate acyltransferase
MSFVYDALVPILWCLIHIFFRLNVRGQHLVPRKGPILFVVAPHSNQFIDPCILQATGGRRIGFLAAAKSMRKLVIGMLARALNSIPVERPQDLAKTGTGRVYWEDTDRVLIGYESEKPFLFNIERHHYLFLLIIVCL